MLLQDRIKEDFTQAIKCGDIIKKSNLRVLIGEISRQPNKDVPDNIVIKIIKKMIKDEISIVDLDGNVDMDYVNLLREYVPKEISEEEIKQWIIENVQLSDFKNKMQAMGLIMKHFGSSVNGNKVKHVLMDLKVVKVELK